MPPFRERGEREQAVRVRTLQGEGGKTIAAALGVTWRTVVRIRRRLRAEGRLP